MAERLAVDPIVNGIALLTLLLIPSLIVMAIAEWQNHARDAKYHAFRNQITLIA